MLDSLFIWLDSSPVYYWSFAFVFGYLALVSAWLPERFPRWSFLLIILLVLLAFRWPGVAFNRELNNPDESAMLAGAITLKSQPVFWKYVDGLTHGPLDQYPLCLLGLVGFSLDFTTARLLGVGLSWLALVGGYLLLRENFSERIARVGIMPAVALYSFTLYWDFIQYSSEHVPVAFLSLGAALLWRGISRTTAGPAYLGTMLLGAVPWAKQQGVLLALWTCAFAGGFILWRWKQGRAQWRLLIACIAGGLTCSVIFGMMILTEGLMAEWWEMFIDVNLAYTEEKPFAASQLLMTFFQFGRVASGFNEFLWPLISVIAIGSVVVFAVKRQDPRRVLLLYLAGTVAVAVWTVIIPGRAFHHYLQFIVLPVTLLATAMLGILFESFGVDGTNQVWTEKWGGQRLVAGVLAGYLALTLVPQIWARALIEGQGLGRMATGGRELVQTPAARLIRECAAPGDRMSVWGWMPMLYVQTQMIQGTREPLTERQLLPWRIQKACRERYLRDLEKWRPRFFVDAVGVGHFVFWDRRVHGHETWPELAAWVSTRYELLSDIDGYRVYRRRDKSEN